MTADDEPFALRCLTVHSHGGGVGRTSLVANLSRELAEAHGLDVLALDWNIDAPGLHHWFADLCPDLALRPGLVEYLEAGRRELRRIAARGPGPDVGAVPALDDHVTVLREGSPTSGRLCLMTAGVIDGGYRGRVRELDWRRSYGSPGGYWTVERLRRQAASDFDVVVVDAPAGRSEIGPAPLLQMSDLVLMVMTANQQSLEGTTELADELAMHAARAGWARRPLKFLFAPSRAEAADPRFLEWMRGPVAEAFDGMRRKGILDPVLQGTDPTRLLLEDDPSARVGQFAARATPHDVGSPLARSYSRLAELVAGLAQGSHVRPAGRTPGEEVPSRVPARPPSPDAPAPSELFAVLHRELADAQAAGDRTRVGHMLALLAEVEHVVGDDAAALVYAEQGARAAGEPDAAPDLLGAVQRLRDRILGGDQPVAGERRREAAEAGRAP